MTSAVRRSAFAVALVACTTGATAAPPSSLESLAPDRTTHGFRPVAVYLDASERPMGARLRHEQTGFILDLLQIESVPQAFIWVNSFPDSDRGEPHTQEHLLLGKGNRGRTVSGLRTMSLTSSSAFTMQWRTCYHFHTPAGPDVFFELLEKQMDALLNPDYTDEEIRREVRNFGVAEDADGSLRLEEKGTVYNEMVSSSDRPFRRLFRAIDHMTYGAEHPLALDSGGWPAAIREMKPTHIRAFHARSHHLGNMGMVAAFSRSVALSDALTQTDAVLVRLQGDDEPRPSDTEADLPRPRSAPTGAVKIVAFPHQNKKRPGNVAFVWPPVRSLPPHEKLLLDLFLANLAGDPTTNLYKIFVDSRTREMDLGARRVFGWSDDDQGQRVLVALTDIAVEHLDEPTLTKMRARIVDELTTIAGWADGADELEAFNERLRSRVVEQRRELAKFVNSPPGFGFRGTGSGWMTHLHQLAKKSEFRRSLTMKTELAAIDALLTDTINPWRERLESWKLLGTAPYAIAVAPSPALLERSRAARRARADAEVARLRRRFSVDDDQEAIRRYKAEVDGLTAELEELEKSVRLPPFVASPPMTRDDQLDFAASEAAPGVDMVASTFDNMSGATLGIAFAIDTPPHHDLVYLSLLPALMREVGVRDGEQVIPFDEMSERIKKEILQLSASFATNHSTGRVELVLRGAGNDPEEASRAVAWMRRMLTPDWRPENIDRIRDVVDQQLAGLRNRMQGSEESWVNDPSNAYRRQDDLLLLATASFLTRAHAAHRMRWLLRDGGDEVARTAAAAYLARLSLLGPIDRDDRTALLDALTSEEAPTDTPESVAELAASFRELADEARTTIREVAKDLAEVLPDLPDDALASDWSYLCRQIRADLLVPPAEVLTELGQTLTRMLQNPRLFVVGSTRTQKRLGDDVKTLLAALPATATTGEGGPKRTYRGGVVDSRLLRRDRTAKEPLFVGLVATNMKGGVFLNSAPGVSYSDRDRERLLDGLASYLYDGYGAHGIFMKTWGAGLAYSNGFRGSPADGWYGYYAERTPELPQTLKFVIDYIEGAPRDPGFGEYAIAQVFGDYRSAQPYEQRAEAMAADLADGLRPEVVRGFREAVLKLGAEEGLVEQLFERMPRVYGAFLPGYGVRSADVAGASYFVIGPESQLALYEAYLKTVEGADARLHRLYPRDFWIEGPAARLRTAVPAASTSGELR